MTPHVCCRAAAVTFAAALAAFAATPASASSLTLNGTGSGFGFTLSTLVSGFPSTGYGTYTLVGVGVSSTGQLVAPDSNTGKMYVFSDTDGQNFGSLTPLPGPGIGSGFTMAEFGGNLYGSQYGGGYYNFNPNGTIGAPISVATGAKYGLWGDTANGRLLSSSAVGLISIDPSNGNYTFINALGGDLIDGVTVTPDGKTAFVADNTADEVVGISLQSYNFGQVVYNTGALGYGNGYGPDGMGVLAGTCKFAGDVVVNNNDGTVGLINPSAPGETTIASGGNRGDYASADPSNGTLFLSQDDQINRLKAPAGCSIGTVTSTKVPEPFSLGILAVGFAGLGFARRRLAA